MNEQKTKQGIVNTLKDFGTRPLADSATALFQSLGYYSQITEFKGSGVFIPTNSVNTPPLSFVLVLVILSGEGGIISKS